MTGSDNVCSVNHLRGFDALENGINFPKPQRACAGESSDLVTRSQSRSRVCGACAKPLTSSDRRRRFCSDACQRATFSASLRRRQTEHRAKFPDRVHARQTLKNAILLGKVRRCSRCEECGEKTYTEGHHTDYRRPLFVTWLCRSCHAALDGGQHFGCGGHADRLRHASTVSAHHAHAVGEA